MSVRLPAGFEPIKEPSAATAAPLSTPKSISLPPGFEPIEDTASSVSLPLGFEPIDDNTASSISSPVAPRGTIGSPSNVSPPSSMVRRTIGDPLVALAKGVVSVPETITGLADIPTMGYAGKALEGAGVKFKETQGILSALYSPEAKAAQDNVSRGFDEGIIPGIKAVVDNPSTIMTGAVESTPSMFAGGAIGKIIKGAPLIAKLGNKVAPIVAGAIGEGAITAGQNVEQVRQETLDGMLTPKQVALNTASGAATGLLGVLGGKVAKRLGLADVDTVMAGGTGAKLTLMNVFGGMVSEGLLEELPQSIQEQVAQNLSLNKPWDEGVAQSGAMGAIIGSIMGGGANIIPSKSDQIKEKLQEQNQPVILPAGVQADLPTQPVIVDQPTASAPAPEPLSDAEISEINANPAIIEQLHAVQAHNSQVQPAEQYDLTESARMLLEQSRAQPQTQPVPIPASAPAEDDLPYDFPARESQPIVQEKTTPETPVLTSETQPIQTPAPVPQPVPAAKPAADNQTISPSVAGRDSLPQAVTPSAKPAQGVGNLHNKEVSFGELRAGETVMEDGKPAKIIKVSHSGGEVLAELEDGRIISATPESLTTTISPPDSVAPHENIPSPVAETTAGKPISQSQPVEGVQPTEKVSSPVAGNPPAEAVPATVFKSAKDVADAFTDSTGHHPDVAGAKLAGIEVRNNMRKAGNRSDPIEPENPYTPDQQNLLAKYRGFAKKSPYLFHTTPSENISSIAATGLEPGHPARQEGVSSPDYVSLSANEELASSFAIGPGKDMMLRVKKGYAFDELEEDMLSGEGAYKTKKAIPPEALEVKVKGKWIPLKSVVDSAPMPAVQSSKIEALKKKLKTERVNTISGKMDLAEFEKKGLAPEKVTRQNWIDLQRANRRSLGQTEGGDSQNAPNAEYEEYHKQAVKDAISKGETVAPVVMKDYPELLPTPDVEMPAPAPASKSNALKGKNRRPKINDKTASSPDSLPTTKLPKWNAEKKGEGSIENWDPSAVFRAGKEAFAEGKSRNPPQAPVIVMQKWLQGWDQANIDAPLPETTPVETPSTPVEKPDKALLIPRRSENGGVRIEVQPIKESRVEVKSPLANLSPEKQARAKALQDRLREITQGRASMGFDPEIITVGGELAKLYVEGGVKTFEQFATNVKADMGDSWGRVKQYLHSIWQAAGATDESLDDVSRTDAKATIEKLEQVALTNPTEEKTIIPKEGDPSESKPTDLGRRSERVESGDAEHVGDEPGSDGNKPSERLGSVEPETAQGVGSQRDDSGKTDGSPGSGDGSPTESGPGRDVSPGRSRSQRTVRRTESPAVTPSNYRITESDRIGKGGLAAKYHDNVSAIRLLKNIESEGRKATPEEQAQLVKYVGWGGLKGAFDPKNKQWGVKNAELVKLLTPEEYEAARRSVLDAHYTSETIVKDGVYAAMQRFGFPGGNMIEAGLGTGHFIGMMPDEMRSRSSYLGIEQDPLTARIAQQLYPEAKIHNIGFQDADLARESFDGAVGNPPFGSQSLYDSNFKEESKHSIHNYFIAKTLSLLRPGGVSGFVVSHYFLDSTDTAARRHIAKIGDFLGAIRLPNNAFKENANTEVTTDIVFFRRRAEGSKHTGNDSWVKTATVKDEKTGQNITVNKWLADNSEMMLGKLTLGGTMYGGKMEATLEPRPGQNLTEDLKKAVEQLPENVYESTDRVTTERLTTPEPIDVPDGAKIGSLFMGKDGRVMRRVSDVQMESRAEPVELKDITSKDRIKGMVSVRDALNNLVKAELSNDFTDEGLESLRKDLNRTYDEFKDKFGYLNQDKNRRLFYDDPEAARLLALEKGFDRGLSADVAKKQGAPARKPSATKAAIFEKRVNAPYREITSVETPKEALMASLNQRGLVDLEYMSTISGKSAAELEQDLGDLVFKTPSGEYQSKEQYLSGNVRKKMIEAETHAKDNPEFQKNVDALKGVIPKDIDPTDIIAPVGAPWVDSKDVSKFAEELTGTTPKVSLFRKHDSGWVFEHDGNGTAETQKWGTPRMPFGELLKSMLNGRPVVVYDKVRNADGSESQIANQQETALAQSKADEIADKWRSWLWQDADRRARLHRTYNDRYNNYVDPHYDGSHLTLPGASSLISLRPHQKNVVWRTLTDMKALYDHVVGAGKTFAGIASFMEMKRLGRVRKPLFVVPNHLVWQWRDDFVKLYPNANILHTEPSDFSKEKRQKVFARIMTGDYDAVIVGHSSFKKIGVSPEVESKFLQEMVAEITQSIEETKAAELEAGRRKRSRTVAQMEKTKESMEEKLAALADRTGQKDQVATFEELGIDGLFVDEAHEFKNLFYSTQMQNVAGMGSPKGSGKAFDLYIKTRYMRDKFGGKAPTVFATGTPISNSLVEMYTMQRYLQPDVLADMGAKTLDGWAKVFADVRGVYEVDPTGTGYRLSTRFANFQNVGELSAAYRSVADVVTMSDLQAAAEAEGKRFPVPKIKGGKPQNIIAERSKDQTSFFGVQKQNTDGEGNPVYDSEGNPIMEFPEGSILYRVDHMPKDPSIDNMLKLTNDARKAGLDMRLIDPSYPDHPDSKINSSVKEIVRIYKKWNADKGTQLVFCDLSVPASARGKATQEAKAAVGEFYFINRSGTIEAVDGVTPVNVEGAPSGVEFFAHKSGSDWVITERSTGLSLGRGSSKKMALLNAKSRINGIKDLEDSIKKAAVPTEQVAAAKDQWVQAKEASDAAKAESADTDQQGDESTAPGISMDELLADGSTFSVYDDVKKKLVKAGIPEHEIAFIHDFDTPEKKSKLFRNVNMGNVRVLMGSTPKMGAGMNVQNRLVAAHHLDAPWRPSDLEQREGRIIRQGNSLYERDPAGFEAEILRYATNRTYDTRMWQLIEHKAAGIEGFRRADRNTRTIADVSGEAANAADMKAAASGDPRIQKELQLRTERQKLENMRKAWERNRYELESRKKWLDGSEAREKSMVDELSKKIAIRDANTVKEFIFTLPDGSTTDKKGEVVDNIIEGMKSGKFSGDIGKYRGFDFKWASGASELVIRSNNESVAVYTEKDRLDGVGFIRRLDNCMNAWDDRIRLAKGITEKDKSEAEEVSRELEKQFSKASELEKTRTDHEAVRRELMESNKKKPVAQDGTNPVANKSGTVYDSINKENENELQGTVRENGDSQNSIHADDGSKGSDISRKRLRWRRELDFIVSATDARSDDFRWVKSLEISDRLAATGAFIKADELCAKNGIIAIPVTGLPKPSVYIVSGEQKYILFREDSEPHYAALHELTHDLQRKKDPDAIRLSQEVSTSSQAFKDLSENLRSQPMILDGYEKRARHDLGISDKRIYSRSEKDRIRSRIDEYIKDEISATYTGGKDFVEGAFKNLHESAILREKIRSKTGIDGLANNSPKSTGAIFDSLSQEESPAQKSERALLEILGVHEHGRAAGHEDAKKYTESKLSNLKKLMDEKRREAVKAEKAKGEEKLLKTVITLGDMLSKYDGGQAAQRIGEGRMSLRSAVNKLVNAKKEEQMTARRELMAAITTKLPGIEARRLRGLLLTMTNKNVNEAPRARALARIDALAEELQKRHLITAIEQVYNDAVKSMGIDVSYRQRIRNVMSGFLVNKPTEATIKDAQELAAFLDAERGTGMDLTLNAKMADMLRKLSGTALWDMPTSSLEDMFDQIYQLTEVGRLYQQGKETDYRRQQDRDLFSVMYSTPIEKHLEIKPTEIGGSLPLVDRFKNKMGAVSDAMRRWYTYHMPMDVVFDLLDGAKHYAGANYRLFKSRLDNSFSAFRGEMQSIETEFKAKVSEFKIGKSESERVGAYAIDRQDTGRKKLLNTLSDGTPEDDVRVNKMLDELKLTANEQAFYDWMRGKLDAIRPSIEKVMKETYNAEMDKVDHYFPFITDWGLMESANDMYGLEMDDTGAWVKNPTGAGGLKKNVQQGFTKSRVGAGQQAVKFDAMRAFHKHMQDVNYYIHVGPTVKYLQEIANRDEYGQSVGKIGQRIVREYLDTMARQGGMNGSHILRWVDTIRNNVGVGTLGFRLSSILIQPSSLLDGFGMIGGRWGFKGALNVTQKKWHDFMKANMTEIRDRIGDDWAFGEAELKSRIARYGFMPLQWLDERTAGAIASGAYEKNLHERGLTVDFDHPDKEALVYAQKMVRRTQASAGYKDQPLAITRGALMGGSRTLARAVYQFQTFSLNKFSLMAHDGLYSAIKNKEPMTGLAILAWTSMAFAVEESIRMGLRMAPGGAGDDGDPEEILKNVGMDYLQIIPWLGSAVSALQYSSFPAPMVEAIASTAKGVKSMLTSKTEAARQRGAVRAAMGAGTMLGVPGTSQVSQWARNSIKSDPEEVSRIIKDSAKRLPSRASDGRIRLESLKAYRDAKRQGLIKPGVTEAEFRARYKATFNRINNP